MLKEKIKSYIDDLHTHDLLVLWNSYCYEVHCYENEIHFMDELNDYLYGMKPLDIISSVGKDFDVNNDYFRDGVYGLESFDYARREMDVDELVEYIIDYHFYGDDDELKEILDSDDDEIDAP